MSDNQPSVENGLPQQSQPMRIEPERSDTEQLNIGGEPIEPREHLDADGADKPNHSSLPTNEYPDIFGPPTKRFDPNVDLTDDVRGVSGLTDREVYHEAVRSAPRFSEDWGGKTDLCWPLNKYHHHNAVLRVLTELAWWTGNDAVQVDRMLRASGLMRERWDTVEDDGTFGEASIKIGIRTSEQRARELQRLYPDAPLVGVKSEPTDPMADTNAAANISEPATNDVGISAADQRIIEQASDSSEHGTLFRHLWHGDIRDFDDLEAAIEELCYILARETRNDPNQILRLMGQSGLLRQHDTRWDVEVQYTGMPGSTTNGRQWVHEAIRRNSTTALPEYVAQAWDDPVPLGHAGGVPPFPLECLPPWLRQWVEECSVSLQVPPDLPAMLALPIAGGGLAREFEAVVRDGWQEPVNLYTVPVLPVGERKSAVVQLATQPIHCLEMSENEKLKPAIQHYQHQHALLEQQLKSAKTKASKSKESADRERLKKEIHDVVQEMGNLEPVRECRLICDDETPEHLTKLLTEQNGRMLQVSAEGNLFEVVLGRYSEHANFDVYLKAHSGDYLSVGRINRDGNKIEHPALSIANAVQPDVITGLAASASLAKRGFLARFLYSLPASQLGHRTIEPPAMKPGTQETYNAKMGMLWRAGAGGNKYCPQQIRFSAAANSAIREFEAWIEPQLAPGGRLSDMSGWATKLAGACVRIATSLHACQQVGLVPPQGPADAEVDAATVAAAVTLCRDYLLPHAEAAMQLMAANPLQEAARRVVDVLRKCGSMTITRREIHRQSGRLFTTAEEMDPVLDLLVEYGYLRTSDGGKVGRGHKSPEYQINPRIPAGDGR